MSNMNKITLEAPRVSVEPPHIGSLWDGFSCGDGTLYGGLLYRAVRELQPQSLQLVTDVDVSDDLSARPHTMSVIYHVSLTFAESDVDENTLTPLWDYLKGVDGYVFRQDDDPCHSTLSELGWGEYYWSPEWPTPLRMQFDWDSSQSPHSFLVVCAVYDDEHLIHLLMHKDLEGILRNMCQILEQYLNRWARETLETEKPAEWYREKLDT